VAIHSVRNQIQIETRKDKTLALVHDFVLNGWPQAYKNGELAPYYARRDELTVSQGCLMCGIRVVIPTKLCSQVLDQIHEGHLGVVKMKSLARSLVWWHSYTLVAIHSVRNHVQVLKSCLFLSRFVSPYSILANFQFAQRETHGLALHCRLPFQSFVKVA
jgi:hypothetical protein